MKTKLLLITADETQLTRSRDRLQLSVAFKWYWDKSNREEKIYVILPFSDTYFPWITTQATAFCKCAKSKCEEVWKHTAAVSYILETKIPNGSKISSLNDLSNLDRSRKTILLAAAEIVRCKRPLNFFLNVFLLEYVEYSVLISNLIILICIWCLESSYILF